MPQEKIALLGDYAKGIDSGDIEVFLVGKNLNTEYISNLELKIEKLINRKVSFHLISAPIEPDLPHLCRFFTLQIFV